ncbi:hypothetical protein BOTBODRAFT_179683 [Botryobasidium botryosum FD-172 SS1]|uniref:Uncharacterized protein n=1 Tax=Botryobasidium botryosum (strain FD-172 SS1) TaxID=930990 RepID=A0A067MAG6_BOTB1|nr:hypothetical protein BOTBODRAFT_179683 [Botryobasidium botryosum FD-172 SS1]
MSTILQNLLGRKTKANKTFKAQNRRYKAHLKRKRGRIRRAVSWDQLANPLISILVSQGSSSTQAGPPKIQTRPIPTTSRSPRKRKNSALTEPQTLTHPLPARPVQTLTDPRMLVEYEEWYFAPDESEPEPQELWPPAAHAPAFHHNVASSSNIYTDSVEVAPVYQSDTLEYSRVAIHDPLGVPLRHSCGASEGEVEDTIYVDESSEELPSPPFRGSFFKAMTGLDPPRAPDVSEELCSEDWHAAKKRRVEPVEVWSSPPLSPYLDFDRRQAHEWISDPRPSASSQVPHVHIVYDSDDEATAAVEGSSFNTSTISNAPLSSHNASLAHLSNAQASTSGSGKAPLRSGIVVIDLTADDDEPAPLSSPARSKRKGKRRANPSPRANRGEKSSKRSKQRTPAPPSAPNPILISPLRKAGAGARPQAAAAPARGPVEAHREPHEPIRPIGRPTPDIFTDHLPPKPSTPSIIERQQRPSAVPHSEPQEGAQPAQASASVPATAASPLKPKPITATNASLPNTLRERIAQMNHAIIHPIPNLPRTKPVAVAKIPTSQSAAAVLAPALPSTVLSTTTSVIATTAAIDVVTTLPPSAPPPNTRNDLDRRIAEDKLLIARYEKAKTPEEKKAILRLMKQRNRCAEISHELPFC